MALPARLQPLNKPFRWMADAMDEVGRQLGFYGRILWDVVTLQVFRRGYGTMLFALISDIAIGAGAFVVGGGMVFVIFSMSFFTGTEVGLQGFKGLEQIGAEAFTGLVGSFANTREVTPLIAGVAFAAQVGAGFTAELGAMRISDEIDALEVMSVPSFIYLVCTRVMAALLCIIPLYLFSLYASFLATELVTTRFFGLSPGIYQHYFRLYLPAIDVVYSLAKACVFAVAVTLIHCYYGFYAKGGPEGVGVAVGRAIRLSIVTVVVLNLLLSLLFWGGGNTVKVAG
ncbi:MAG TPA: ABC transporter permease [Acidimicrobiales bacterium]|jgi:phospholipid/cholesterol/gamma-HCH transport system permease protein|nr:ABC transporter permease [Acidimicrobiales bacterium]